MLDLPVTKESIKSKIVEIISQKDIANIKGQKGRDFVFEKYDFKNTLKLYKNLFEKLLKVENK